MAANFMGFWHHVRGIYDLQPKEAGEDFGVGTQSGDILSLPDLQEGEELLAGISYPGMSEAVYAVKTLEDINSLRYRQDDILYGQLRLYAGTRKSSLEFEGDCH